MKLSTFTITSIGGRMSQRISHSALFATSFLKTTFVIVLSIGLQQVALQEPAHGLDALERSASWDLINPAQQEEQLRLAFTELGASEQLINEYLSDIEEELSDERADRLDILTRALIRHSNDLQRSVNELEVSIDQGNYQSIQKSLANLKSEQWQSLPVLVQQTYSAWLARKLAKNRLFDEAINAFAAVDPTMTLDPASTLFYRAASHHALLNKEEAIADLRRLLENEEDCPTRYVRTAKMMLADLQPLKEDSLDEISRIMGDVTRRLDLGRTDKQVKSQEQKIIDKLDKLIEDLEQQQQQQQQQQQASSGQGGQSEGGQSTPMNESQIAGGSGNGDVDRKQIQQKDGWGNLPPAERQQAIQQISRDLPTHYREAIEAYFRKLATDRK